MKSDFRFTIRSVKASPWYAGAIIGVTGVTVALATTTFAIVDGVLFRPLPYLDTAALVAIPAACGAFMRPWVFDSCVRVRATYHRRGKTARASQPR